ncbi:MAG: Mur ligase family protein [Gemmatimonadales bacterium]|jgi:UDP-N-acetylmuramyl tripeptide synthase
MPPVLEDSRRLTGPNLVSPGPGAIVDVRVEGQERDALAKAWERRARQVLDRVGWTGEGTHVRVHRAGASLAISAPVDVLYAATEVNEWALAAAMTDLAGARVDEELEDAAVRLAALIATESNPALLALRDGAAARGVTFLSDDETASVGLGAGSISWPVAELPAPDRVAWDEVHDVPVVLVTGTNGKTTTVRLLAAMIEAAGRTPGFSSTDGVYIGRELADGGDYSGPGGARTVLRDRRVEAAVLETARGGMLRRGLAVERADGAAVTNVGVDHLGEYGLHDVEQIADAKLVVSRAVTSGGRLVLNADDPVLAERGGPPGARLVWTSTRPETPALAAHLAAGGEAVVAEGSALVRHIGSRRSAIVEVADVPITLGGAARYNVDNALVALGLAPALDVPDSTAARALAAFQPSSARLPGRTNLFRLGEATAIVDFVHNPHGMRAMAETALELPARRRLVVLGQAGDRDDDSIRALARAACRMRPQRVIVKELTRYLRGRPAGEVPALIRRELEGADPAIEVVDATDELDAVRQALEWCEPGDLLVLPIQAQREAVVGWLGRLEGAGWRPGRPVEPHPEDRST